MKRSPEDAFGPEDSDKEKEVFRVEYVLPCITMLAKVTQIVILVVLFTALAAEASVDRTVPKRSKMGGWRKVDVNDPEVQEVAAKATAHLEGARNSTMVYRLQEVDSAKVQIVRGKNFQLGLKVGQTDCFRQANVNVQNCQIVKVEQCVVTVWVWLKTFQVTNFTCGKEKSVDGGEVRTKRIFMLGGETDIDVNRDVVIQAATFATTELTSRSNGRYRVQHQRIIKATSGVVAGVLYRMTLEVSVISTDDGKPETTICTVTVWDQAWRTPRYMLREYKCDRLIS